MAQWEYRMLRLGWKDRKDEDAEAALNELGSEGWELTVQLQSGVLVFKRRVERIA